MSRVHALPRIHDHHTHVSLYAALLDCPRLDGCGREAALARLRQLPRDRVTLVLGWNSAGCPLGPRDLDGLPPAVVVNLSLHGFLLTPAAQEALRPEVPEIVERYRDDLWRERNIARMLIFLGRLSPLDGTKLARFLEMIHEVGVESAEDMLLVDGPALEVLAGSGRAFKVWAAPETYLSLGSQARKGIHGLKLFLDGALGTRTAALAEPFLGGGSGLLTHENEALRERIGSLASSRMPFSIHAIGERAVEQALGVLEELDQDGARPPSVRLEHVQFITESQARRAKALGLVLSMQPNFSSDSVDYADRLGIGLLEANNPFRMLIDRVGFSPGRDLVFGSDGMPHGMIPSLQWSLFPAYPGQRLSLEEWLAGYGREPGTEGPVRVSLDSEARRVDRLPDLG